jgi:hypothetical protein
MYRSHKSAIKYNEVIVQFCIFLYSVGLTSNYSKTYPSVHEFYIKPVEFPLNWSNAILDQSQWGSSVRLMNKNNVYNGIQQSMYQCFDCPEKFIGGDLLSL